MKIVRIVIVTLIAISSLILAGLLFTRYFKEKPAGIYVNTNPVSDVYINGTLVGKAPYTGTFKAGDILLKLVPGSGDPTLVVYETRISLLSGIQTIVRREFGVTEDASSGDVISFDKIGGTETGLIVVSIPENAQVSIDGLPQGFAPYKTSAISPAEHQITVRAPGYTDRIMTVKTQEGYRLSLYAKLAKLKEPEVVATPVPVTRTYVKILTTPTGFLRVRTLPGMAGEEIAQVNPGSQYPFLEYDVATGWVKIEYEAPKAGLPNGITGWVSGKYIEKISVTEEATKSANIK